VPGEVKDWRNLAHRSVADDLEATGMTLPPDIIATRTDLLEHRVLLRGAGGTEKPLSYDRAVADTGALQFRIVMRDADDRRSGRLLGLQLFPDRHAESAKRIDIATAVFRAITVGAMSDLDLSYSPPRGSPWDAVQMGAQARVREVGRH
jgi:hypothetical protein